MNRPAAAKRLAGAKAGTPGTQDPGLIPRNHFAGGHRIRVTPVPIPNTEVKPDTADGTARETVWESRSLPALFSRLVRSSSRAFFFLGLVPRRNPGRPAETFAGGRHQKDKLTS